MPRYDSGWVDIAREQYLGLPEDLRRLIDARITELLDGPDEPGTSHDPQTDWWTTPTAPAQASLSTSSGPAAVPAWSSSGSCTDLLALPSGRLSVPGTEESLLRGVELPRKLVESPLHRPRARRLAAHVFSASYIARATRAPARSHGCTGDSEHNFHGRPCEIRRVVLSGRPTSAGDGRGDHQAEAAGEERHRERNGGILERSRNARVH